MCGRYYLEDDDFIQEVRKLLEDINRMALERGARDDYAERAAQMSRGEIFPTNVAPVILAHSDRTIPGPMRWGFPKWDGKGVVINARGETAMEKSMFKRSLLERRVVVPTTGFFEWRHEGGKSKEKYLFRHPGEKVVYLAGIYNHFDVDGKREARFTILTTAANESMAPYHDRMPVSLRRKECEEWLLDAQTIEKYLGRTPAPLEATPTPTEESAKEAKERDVQQSLF